MDFLQINHKPECSKTLGFIGPTADPCSYSPLHNDTALPQEQQQRTQFTPDPLLCLLAALRVTHFAIVASTNTPTSGLNILTVINRFKEDFLH